MRTAWGRRAGYATRNLPSFAIPGDQHDRLPDEILKAPITRLRDNISNRHPLTFGHRGSFSSDCGNRPTSLDATVVGTTTPRSLHHFYRCDLGSSLALGLNRHRAGSMVDIVAGRDRQRLGETAEGGHEPSGGRSTRGPIGAGGGIAASAVALQRAAGNRAATRALVGAAGRAGGLARCTCGGSRGEQRRGVSGEEIEQAGTDLLRRAVVTRKGTLQLARHRDDLMTYSGGQSGALAVFSAGNPIYSGPGVSGHPGHASWELDVGPVPDGTYPTHPQKTNPSVDAPQDGTCNANAIASGYQELTDNTPSPCDPGMHHYCNIPCPTPAAPGRKCFSAVDCWGKHRLRIEGVSTPQAKPDGNGTVRRSGMYLHGGNPADTLSSGCVKSLDQDAFFAAVRTLTGDRHGRVPLCVGASCKVP